MGAGHASIYGVFFDTGKAGVKPQSDAALKEMARLLEQTRRSSYTSPAP